MGSLFGKGKHPPKPNITEQDRAVLVRKIFFLINKYCSILSFQQLKQQRDRLNQNRQRIEIQLEKEREVAKQLLKNGQKE